jgi:YARHG domain
MRSIALGVSIGLVCGPIAVLAVPLPALANCYELIGCTNKDYFKQSDLKQLGCQPLWEVRNWIYKENGYCFHTQKAINAFGNAGCKYDDVADVPLNAAERHNVTAIKKVEAKKGC